MGLAAWADSGTEAGAKAGPRASSRVVRSHGHGGQAEGDGIDGYVTARNARMIFFRRPDAISAALPANHLGRVMTMRWQ